MLLACGATDATDSTRQKERIRASFAGLRNIGVSHASPTRFGAPHSARATTSTAHDRRD
jgi:hypothetical protein